MPTRRSPRTADPSANTPATRRKDPAAVAAPVPDDASMVLAVKIYFATVDSLLAAEAALGVILRDSIDPVQQSTCSAEILSVRRELELLKNKRRILMNGPATITPPTADMVTTAQENAIRLAKVIATTAQLATIVGLVKDSLALFERLGV